MPACGKIFCTSYIEEPKSSLYRLQWKQWLQFSPRRHPLLKSWKLRNDSFQLEIFKPTGIYIYVYINKMTKSNSFLHVQCAESSHFGDFRILPNFPNSPSNFQRDENLDISAVEWKEKRLSPPCTPMLP